MKKEIDKEKRKSLDLWQSRFEKSKTAYSDDLAEMKLYDSYYEGSRTVYNKEVAANKVASNVRNICYELIESQVDSSIPLPKVTPIHEEDAEKAKLIEKVLCNEIKLMRMHKINDMQERTVPVMGGSFFLVEWDNKKGTHCTTGDLSIQDRNPKHVIPQAGVNEIEDMDYIFVWYNQTKSYIKRKYDVEVQDGNTEMTESDDVDTTDTDLVTVITAYYRDDDGNIGKFTWANDDILEDIKDYQARRLERCVKCGAIKEGNVCPNCGSKKFEVKSEDYEELVDSITISGGKTLNPFDYAEKEMLLDENGLPMVDENGQTMVTFGKKKVPYYKPNVFPFVLRQNVSRSGKLLGFSDIKAIRDQQDAIKKYGTKIDEKLLKGGSYVTLPDGVEVEKNSEDLNILRLKTPNEKAMIDVINLQPQVSYDQTEREQNYQSAKSTLGITDAFQGKYDASATSGTAKQYSINQAAGRLESKRVMKNDAWSKLYEVMFKFLLAYADQPIDISSEGTDGNTEFAHFDRYEFLKVDASGELYWDDEFIFETDPTSSVMANREAMWNANDMKLQSGAFGQVGDLKTAKLYWTLQYKHNYPSAGEILRLINQRIEEEGEQNNALSYLPNGNENIQPQI